MSGEEDLRIVDMANRGLEAPLSGSEDVLTEVWDVTLSSGTRVSVSSSITLSIAAGIENAGRDPREVLRSASEFHMQQPDMLEAMAKGGNRFDMLLDESDIERHA